MTDRRSVMQGLALSGASGLLPGLANAATPVDDTAFILSTVDPELRDMAARLLAAPPRPPLTTKTLPIARQTQPGFAVPPAKVPVRKVVLERAGLPPLALYIFNEKPRGSRRPALLHTHGGGFILGAAQFSAPAVQDICLALDCPAVSVDYRLAPETTYQGSVEDNYAGLKWLHDHADDVGADRGKIAVIGESAGGGHAALLAITARDRGEVKPAFQCLIYPMLDDRTGTSGAVPPHLGRLIWTAQTNHFGWQSFLGMTPGTAHVPPKAVPARTLDLKGLPPTFIGTGSIDLFVDEDITYARRLVAAGIPTELLVVPGAFHGFEVFVPESRPARRFKQSIIDALTKALL